MVILLAFAFVIALTSNPPGYSIPPAPFPVAGEKMGLATSVSKGLMDSIYVNILSIDKYIKPTSGKQLVKLCSFRGNIPGGFNGLFIIRSIYGAGDSGLVMVNACLGGDKLVYINAYNLFKPKSARCSIKKKSYSDGFDLYIELGENCSISPLYILKDSKPLIMELSTDTDLEDVILY